MGQSSSYYYETGKAEEKQINTLTPQDRNSTEDPYFQEEVLDEAPATVSKVNLLNLPTKELRLRLNDFQHMTKHDIRNAASKLTFSEEKDGVKTNFVDEFEWYQRKQSDTIQVDREQETVHQEKAPDNIDMHSHMDVALKILKISPGIKTLRFKLVPAKLSEFMFWSAVFHILETYSPDAVGASETLPTALKTNRSRIVSSVQNQQIKPTTEETCDTNNADLQAIIKQKDEELASLRVQYAKLKSDLLHLQEEQRKTLSKCHHPGKWVLSAESKEFLALEEDIKKKLRDGKEKRLKEVLEQMKFILDTDNLEDSNGEWSCCGQSIYTSVGCKQK